MHDLFLKNRFEFRLSFSHDCENRIDASVIWNSWTPHGGWPRYCGQNGLFNEGDDGKKRMSRDNLETTGDESGIAGPFSS